jgi:hypothetical protein
LLVGGEWLSACRHAEVVIFARDAEVELARFRVAGNDAPAVGVAAGDRLLAKVDAVAAFGSLRAVAGAAGPGEEGGDVGAEGVGGGGECGGSEKKERQDCVEEAGWRGR